MPSTLLESHFVYTMLKPPLTLQQTSNLQYQRCTTEGLNANQVQLFDLPEIFFTYQPSNRETRPIAMTADATSSHFMRISVDRTSADEPSNCMVCLEQAPNAILLECGHSGLCIECANVLWAQARRCPLCRQGFAAVMRIIANQDGLVDAIP